METIFVADGLTTGGRAVDPNGARRRKLTEITAYLYAGWKLATWGTAPTGSNLEGLTGFYFVRIADHSGPGFGAGPQCDRLRSGLHAAMIVEGGNS